MVTYLILGLSRKDVEVFTFADVAAANRAIETRFANCSTSVVSEVGDLASKSGPSLVAMHNALAPDGAKPVNKFETRSIGAERVFGLLESQFRNQPVESEAANSKVASAAETQNGENEMAKKGKKAAKVAKKKNGTALAVRENSSLGRVLKYGVEGSKTLGQLVPLMRLADNGRNQKSRAKFRVKKVAALVGGTFEIDDKEVVSITLPKGKTLESIFGIEE